MLSQMTQQPVYTDIQGLTELKAAARKDERAALETVAKQFESIFLQMMLKSMRDASPGGGLLDGQQGEFYRDMYDKQLAVDLGERGGIGLAEMMIRQLEGSIGGGKPAAEGERGVNSLPERLPFSVDKPSPQSLEKYEVSVESVTRAEMSSTEFTPGDPNSFIRALRPHAERVARELGVAPEALLAQAGLETGWGRSVIRRVDGASSHNLFNIKADHRWQGERVSKQTLEYREGIGAMERAAFRAYDSYAASFDDYAAFIKESPRYQQALAQGGDAAAYARELQRAGYATDPNYAEKIGEILRREGLHGTPPADEETLKFSAAEPLTEISAAQPTTMTNNGG